MCFVEVATVSGIPATLKHGEAEGAEISIANGVAFVLMAPIRTGDLERVLIRQQARESGPISGQATGFVRAGRRNPGTGSAGTREAGNG